MNYDDWKSTDLMDGIAHYSESREPREPRHLQPCRYCVTGERQVLWPPEAPTMERCQVCGDTHAIREVTGKELSEAFAAQIRRSA